MGGGGCVGKPNSVKDLQLWKMYIAFYMSIALVLLGCVFHFYYEMTFFVFYVKNSSPKHFLPSRISYCFLAIQKKRIAACIFALERGKW